MTTARLQDKPKKIPPRKQWEKWIRSKADEFAVDQGCWFDIEAAEHVRKFFSGLLRHSSGLLAGKKFELLDWQWDKVIAPLYGWRRNDERRTRRYRRGYIQIPKKNGKSTLCSGLCLYHLVADGEIGAEVYCAASDRGQAGIVYKESAAMVKASPALSARLRLAESSKTIAHMKTGSVFRALSADAGSNEGLKISFLINDELHAQKTRKLWDSLRYGGAARLQPLMLSITTAGWDRTTICFEQYQYAKKILEGRFGIDDFDSEFFACVFEAEESDDWTDEKVWFKANPSLGHTITLPSFRADFLEARQSPATENAFRRYRLDQWTEQDVRWISLEKWAACAKTYDEEDLAGFPCYGGLDMASTQDICAFVLVFPLAIEGAELVGGEEVDGQIVGGTWEGGELVPATVEQPVQIYRVLCYFWAPEGANQLRERLNKQRIDNWFDLELIKKTDGNEINYDVVRRDILAIVEKFDCRGIGRDPWNSVQIGQQLEAEGLDVVKVGQGRALSPFAKEFIKNVNAATFEHPNHPVLNWMAANVTATIDAAETISISKDKSIEKIDGIVGTVIGLGTFMGKPLEGGGIKEAIWGS